MSTYIIIHEYTNAASISRMLAKAGFPKETWSDRRDSIRGWTKSRLLASGFVATGLANTVQVSFHDDKHARAAGQFLADKLTNQVRFRDTVTSADHAIVPKRDLDFAAAQLAGYAASLPVKLA